MKWSNGLLEIKIKINRSLIFRAWDKIKNQMILANVIDFRDNSVESVETIDGYKIEGCLNFVLMQFTGLTDKNGKKIFEGDVCKYEKRHGVIVFNPELGFFVDGWLDDFRNYPERWEVIGNIFENKELLK